MWLSIRTQNRKSDSFVQKGRKIQSKQLSVNKPIIVP